MKTKLTFIQKNVYGKTLFYPNDVFAAAICKVARQKTMTLHDLEILQVAGFEILTSIELKVIGKSAESYTEKGV